MFGLDPFNPAVVIGEMVLLLAFAAFVGWLLGRLVLSGRVSALQSLISRKEAELDECRRSKVTGGPSVIPTPVYKTPPAEPKMPPVYVPADPLLPVINQDDTPALVPADSLPPVPVEVLPVVSPIPEVPRTNMPAPELPPVPAVPELAAVGITPTGNSEAAVLNRIAARVNELNFDRIGRATAAEADDLKDIVGIGPFLERKLHSLGIYTFRQVANFTKEDVAKVNEIIEFFPGRIERDNWVEQSTVFHERKYGQQNG